MTDETRFRMGAEVRCSDGPCGALTRVVVDPVAEAITHLVVEPKHQQGRGRLVPIDLVDQVEDHEIRLRCTLGAFGDLESAEETEFLPGGDDFAGNRAEHVLRRPYYRLGLTGYGGFTLADPGDAVGHPEGSEPRTVVTRDTIPVGEVAIRRGDHVHATDGEIGSVQGLVVDPRNHHVTHVLLQEGHVLSHKDVAIPIANVVGFDDQIRLNLSVAEVEHLPSVEFDKS